MSFSRDLDDLYSFVNAVFSVRNASNFDSQSRISYPGAPFVFRFACALCREIQPFHGLGFRSINGEDEVVNLRRSASFSRANRPVVGRLLSSLLHDSPRLHSCNLARKTRTSTLVFCNSIPVHLPITNNRFTHRIEVFGLPQGGFLSCLFFPTLQLLYGYPRCSIANGARTCVIIFRTLVDGSELIQLQTERMLLDLQSSVVRRSTDLLSSDCC